VVLYRVIDTWGKYLLLIYPLCSLLEYDTPLHNQVTIGRRRFLGENDETEMISYCFFSILLYNVNVHVVIGGFSALLYNSGDIEAAFRF
jgi:hypothetical protein